MSDEAVRKEFDPETAAIELARQVCERFRQDARFGEEIWPEPDDIAALIQPTIKTSRSAAIQECADEVREQKKKYPADIFQHIENFREVECWDCCGAATALHTMGWLADTVEALKEG